MTSRLAWPPIIARAREIVAEFETALTLRGLFYRLVAEALLPNTSAAYKRLSHLTAAARREGTFPDLIDLTRRIHRPLTFESPAEAREWLRRTYRRDRTQGQDVSLYLGVEKDALLGLLDGWFDDLGLPILPLRGYASQSFVQEVKRDVSRSGRSAVLIYAGDFDPSGEDIDRDFIVRAGCFAEVVRVALDHEQVRDYDLPPMLGKTSDARAADFERRHGRLVQVELDALPPDVLRDLYQEAIDRFWDVHVYEAVLVEEEAGRAAL